MSSTIFDREERPGPQEHRATPMIKANASQCRPISNDQLDKLLQPFVGVTVGQAYFGPSGFSEDGTPWIVMLCKDARRPKFYRDSGVFAMLAWRWNAAPAALVSFTAMSKDNTPPHQRWMAADTNPVVQAIRERGRFLVCIAHASGNRSSGWFDAVFVDTAKQYPPPYLKAFQEQWQEPTPGIRYSRIGVRFDPLNRTDLCEQHEAEIPLWPEPVSDAWKTLCGTGPWTSDLEPKDLRITKWASSAYWTRQRMAGFVEVIKERQEIDGAAPLANADGYWMVKGAGQEPANRELARFPVIRAMIAALAGPKPDAKLAYENALRILCDSEAIYALVSNIMRWLGAAGDEEFAQACQGAIHAALLDSSVTGTGTRRPWLKNVGSSRLELESVALDLTAPLEDVNNLWRLVTDITEILDGGLWFGPRDFPAPPDVVNTALESVRLEGSVEDAHARAIDLLREAQEARQWSVPWGARVQVDFGPFVAMKIHENAGEFACLFVDDQERYLHVAIGIGNTWPQINCPPFLRKQDDSDELIWNEDAQVSLELIAAAIVRDFLVVEEREQVFLTRHIRRRIGGQNISTVVYLPRVHYSTAQITEPEAASDNEGQRRVRHSVSQHLRRAGNASAAQRFLAQRYGVHLPEGFTFVRPHDRGNAAQAERVRIYRSRSASRMLFQEIAVTPEGSRPAWFDFERDCARLLSARGMSVIHQAAHRDGDGGVDLFAVDANEISWVVQCKCWSQSRPVGPDVIRELVGAIAGADRGGTRTSRGMIVTTSRFTSGAVSEALSHGFTIIDGEGFAAQMRTLVNDAH